MNAVLIHASLIVLPHCCYQAAADAENEDNLSEQKRQIGKRVRYGEIIQVFDL